MIKERVAGGVSLTERERKLTFLVIRFIREEIRRYAERAISRAYHSFDLAIIGGDYFREIDATFVP